MLLLTSDQVEYCLVQSEDLSCNQVFSGVCYQDRLFTLDRSFPKAEKNYALQLARQQYLDGKGYVIVLVIEEADRYTIWSQNPGVIRQLPEAVQQCRIEQFDLAELVAQMRNIGGISIQDRSYRLKTYKRCFIGSEAAAWFQGHLELSQEDAIRLGQRLIDEHWMHHVADDHDFKAEQLYYRFYWDEQN